MGYLWSCPTCGYTTNNSRLKQIHLAPPGESLVCWSLVRGRVSISTEDAADIVTEYETMIEELEVAPELMVAPTALIPGPDRVGNMYTAKVQAILDDFDIELYEPVQVVETEDVGVYQIVDGHHRTQVAIAAGITELWVELPEDED